MENYSREVIGLSLLRIGLAVVFLWFGFSQIFDGVAWVTWVPQWSVDLLNIPPAMIVFFNGVFEVIAGALLAANLFVRPVAVLLTLHLALVTFEVGASATGVRDLGLTIATASLFFLYKK